MNTAPANQNRRYDVCPLTGTSGSLVRSVERDDLLAAYHRYLGIELPPELAQKYVPAACDHLRSQSSGLEWFNPCRLGESDYYEFLGRLPWYYSDHTWDKLRIREILQALSSASVIEVGCGTGAFLKQLREDGISVAGVEINQAAIAAARRDNINVYHADEASWETLTPDTLLLLQTLEHVGDPVGMLQRYISLDSVRRVIVSVPCADSLLSRCSDPLVWPPHHATLWTLKAFHTLAIRTGLRVESHEYQRASWSSFNGVLNLEPHRRLRGLPAWPQGFAGRLLFKLAKLLRQPWALHSHSLIVILER